MGAFRDTLKLTTFVDFRHHKLIIKEPILGDWMSTSI